MGRALVLLSTAEARAKAVDWIKRAPWNTRVTFQGPKRSLEQNARFWAMLTDISTQTTHHNIRLAPDDWRLLFLDALKREVRAAPNLDGTGFVNLGRSSSELSKEEFSDLFDIMEAWGAAHEITFHDGREGAVANNAAPVAEPHPRELA